MVLKGALPYRSYINFPLIRRGMKSRRVGSGVSEWRRDRIDIRAILLRVVQLMHELSAY